MVEGDGAGGLSEVIWTYLTGTTSNPIYTMSSWNWTAILSGTAVALSIGSLIFYGYRDDYRRDPKKFKETLYGISSMVAISVLIRPWAGKLLDPVYEWVVSLIF